MREKIIKKYITNKFVLDIGSIGNYNDSLYYFIKKFADRVIGTDIRQSSEFIQAEMQYQKIGGKFDVVVIGDTIEHVENQGMLIDNARRHLVKGGILIITTPNARSLAPFLTFMSKGFKYHTHWHDIHTLKRLLKKHFRLKEVAYYCGNRRKYRFFDYIPFLNRNQIIVVAEKSS